MEPGGQSTSSESRNVDQVVDGHVIDFCDSVQDIYQRLWKMGPSLRKAALIAVEELLAEAP